MKIFLAQQHYHIGHFEYNTQKIITAILDAREAGADLVVFSELCVCGYPPRDFLEFDDFIVRCERAVAEIAAATQHIAVVIGAPERNPIKAGKNLYNAAYFIENQVVKKIVRKTCLPTYDVFDEYRYFEPATSWEIVEYKNKKIAITICEDIWNLDQDPLYRTSPMDELISLNPDLMINLSASPFDYTHQDDRKTIVKLNALKYNLPVFYCNTVGSQTEIVFDGNSLVADRLGNLVGILPSFEEALTGFDVDSDNNVLQPLLLHAHSISNNACEPEHLDPNMNIDHIYSALISGIRDYFQKMGFQKAILGSSGGIDSAVTLALAVEALGKEQVTAVLMPSEFSSDHSISDALQLSKNLDNPHHIIPIHELNQQMQETLRPIFKDAPFGLAEENIQSRLRGNILMALANKFGFILLNTSNKSELSTGYGTLYGDMAGGIGVLGDCYKMQVYALAKWINRNHEIIPRAIIEKAPSAELRPNQKDSDSLPDYDILDRILYLYIERRKGPEDIKQMGFDPQLVDRTLSMVNRNEYKRNQFCPIIRISPKAFGVGRRMPIVGKYLT